jgi:hypothetical protein
MDDQIRRVPRFQKEPCRLRSGRLLHHVDPGDEEDDADAEPEQPAANSCGSLFAEARGTVEHLLDRFDPDPRLEFPDWGEGVTKYIEKISKMTMEDFKDIPDPFKDIPDPRLEFPDWGEGVTKYIEKISKMTMEDFKDIPDPFKDIPDPLIHPFKHSKKRKIESSLNSCVSVVCTP